MSSLPSTCATWWQVDEAGAPLEPLAGAVDRLVEACTEAVEPTVIDPETGRVTWYCDVTDVLGGVFNREPLRGRAAPRAPNGKPGWEPPGAHAGDQPRRARAGIKRAPPFQPKGRGWPHHCRSVAPRAAIRGPRWAALDAGLINAP